MNPHSTNGLIYIGLALAITYGLYVFYAAVMNIKRVRDAGKLTTLGVVFGYPTLVIGLVLDLLVNVFVMSIILLEIPQELTVTSRLKRHQSSTGWRLAVVKFFEPVLDPLDPSGDHV
jgi:uncharacterized membrane protein YhaH (DUF805 family)